MSILRNPNHCGKLGEMLGIVLLVSILVLTLNLEARQPQSPPQALQTAPATPSHPLDPLTAQEFAILKDILQNRGKFSDKTIYNWVQLQEPPKDEVLVFQPGQKFRREAQVVAVSPPAGNTVSATPEYRFGEESSFTQRHFWVTKYHPEQLYAAGKYPNQAPADYKDDLFEYAKKNENIYKEDVVLWYSVGFTHITRPEDYPIMPAGKMAVSFTPVGFFEKSPALGYAHIEKEKPGSGKP